MEIVIGLFAAIFIIIIVAMFKLTGKNDNIDVRRQFSTPPTQVRKISLGWNKVYNGYLYEYNGKVFMVTESTFNNLVNQLINAQIHNCARNNIKVNYSKVKKEVEATVAGDCSYWVENGKISGTIIQTIIQ